MKINYKPKNVCSSHISFEIEEGRIHNLVFQGGCNGNLKALGKLVEGMEATSVASLLAGNTCGRNSTSCADQLSRAIEEALQQET